MIIYIGIFKIIKKRIIFCEYFKFKAGYLITWTPYTFVLLYNSFKSSEHKDYPILSNISAVLAKSSVVWSTLVYILTNKNIKSKIFLFRKTNLLKKRKNYITENEMNIYFV